MKALDHLAGVAICARATKPHGTVMLIQGMRTARETPSGGSLGVVGGLRQVTSKIQRATPRDLVHVSIFAGGNRIGASKASLNGGPKLSTSDDGGMSIILSGGGKGGIDIHPTAAASDRSRVKATDDRKRMGSNYSPRCLHDTRYSNTGRALTLLRDFARVNTVGEIEGCADGAHHGGFSAEAHLFTQAIRRFDAGAVRADKVAHA